MSGKNNGQKSALASAKGFQGKNPNEKFQTRGFTKPPVIRKNGNQR